MANSNEPFVQQAVAKHPAFPDFLLLIATKSCPEQGNPTPAK